MASRKKKTCSEHVFLCYLRVPTNIQNQPGVPTYLEREHLNFSFYFQIY